MTKQIDTHDVINGPLSDDTGNAICESCGDRTGLHHGLCPKCHRRNRLRDEMDMLLIVGELETVMDQDILDKEHK